MDRIEEIRHFVLSVYGEHDIVGYGDKALAYCKDLLTALEVRDKAIKYMTDDNVVRDSLIKHLQQLAEAAEQEVAELKETNSNNIMCYQEQVKDLQQRIKELEAALGNMDITQVMNDSDRRKTIKELRDENKRLRAALSNIIGSCDCCHERCDSCTIHITIAREALKKQC